MRKRIAVIGSGVSGLLCARLLAARHDVFLYEVANRLGGHAHTVDFQAHGCRVAADVGFMVFNRRTYPNFTRLLELLGIEAQPSDMSFSVRDDAVGLEYQSNRLFAQRRNLANPRFLRMLWDILRFNRAASERTKNIRPGAAVERSAAASRQNGTDGASSGHGISISELAWLGGYGNGFLRHYLLPMAGAIWSAPARLVEDFPAAFLVRFLQNHGLLQLRNRPQWLTIPGGSRRYVTALAAPMADRIRLNCPVRSVRRVLKGVLVDAAARHAEFFDAAVFATHAPQSLAMLVDATPTEHAVLGAFAYQSNDAALHTDLQFMPRRRRAWASWNCLAAADPGRPAAVTYDLNRLQRLGAPEPICVTLNPPGSVAAKHLVQSLEFAHPLYSAAAVAAQARRDELHRDGRVFFCGAYWGYGFHEDGVNSALAVGEHFGVTLDDIHSCTVASTAGESLTCGARR